ncbi:MAG: HpcH/HpaI aldolase/citrate lyase family protein [Spirochaetes bacterium]|nr:HpcH/HpaI aldolase/citrate lyase family protein [Spirochaetota bacterium]
MEHLIKMLRELYCDHGLVALKGGTEVEDMSFEEIAFLKALGGDLLPIIVKIGGPEARNDMRACKSIGIDCILAPMIESEYALVNFVQTVQSIYGDDLPFLAINIETITGFENLDRITSCEEFAYIDQVTVGRSDLSASMHKTNDDEDVYMVTESIVRWSEELGKITSVGGKITVNNAPVIQSRIRPHRINTRHMVFELSKCPDIGMGIRRGLEFEIELYKSLADIEPSKRMVYAKLIDTTHQRLIPKDILKKAAG